MNYLRRPVRAALSDLRRAEVRGARAYRRVEVTRMFEIVNEEGVVCGEPYAESHVAAQDAECLHAESGSKHKVVESGTNEVFYETQGAPE